MTKQQVETRKNDDCTHMNMIQRIMIGDIMKKVWNDDEKPLVKE